MEQRNVDLFRFICHPSGALVLLKHHCRFVVINMIVVGRLTMTHHSSSVLYFLDAWCYPLRSGSVAHQAIQHVGFF
jgi:hypothetical protein